MPESFSERFRRFHATDAGKNRLRGRDLNHHVFFRQLVERFEAKVTRIPFEERLNDGRELFGDFTLHALFADVAELYESCAEALPLFLHHLGSLIEYGLIDRAFLKEELAKPVLLHVGAGKYDRSFLEVDLLLSAVPLEM